VRIKPTTRISLINAIKQPEIFTPSIRSRT
jgi:hypothetical protein